MSVFHLFSSLSYESPLQDFLSRTLSRRSPVGRFQRILQKDIRVSPYYLLCWVLNTTFSLLLFTLLLLCTNVSKPEAECFFFNFMEKNWV